MTFKSSLNDFTGFRTVGLSMFVITADIFTVVG